MLLGVPDLLLLIAKQQREVIVRQQEQTEIPPSPPERDHGLNFFLGRKNGTSGIGVGIRGLRLGGTAKQDLAETRWPLVDFRAAFCFPA